MSGIFLDRKTDACEIGAAGQTVLGVMDAATAHLAGDLSTLAVLGEGDDGAETVAVDFSGVSGIAEGVGGDFFPAPIIEMENEIAHGTIPLLSHAYIYIFYLYCQ